MLRECEDGGEEEKQTTELADASKSVTNADFRSDFKSVLMVFSESGPLILMTHIAETPAPEDFAKTENPYYGSDRYQKYET